MAAQGPAGERERAWFIDKELGKATLTGCTTWRATPLGERGHRPRHRRVRGGHDPHLVGQGRAGGVPWRAAAADDRRRRWVNGYRTRLWKTELAAFAAETGLQVTVCHLPPGTSKWNKIEHRLFSHISMNWRGRPLTSHEVIVNAIAATTTRTGLTVSASSTPATTPRASRHRPGDQEPGEAERAAPPRLPRRVELLPRPAPAST